MDIVMIEDNKNNIVKKHQDLVSAAYKLSDNSTRMLIVLIGMIRKSDDEFKQYAIKISYFKELIGSTGSKKIYEYAHKIAKELLSNPIKIGDEQFNWVSYAKYVKGESYIIFEIHRNLKPYLLDLQKNFLQYDIINVLSLRSNYLIRLYELCKDHYMSQNYNKKKKKSIKFEMKIDRMREMFQIPNSYQYSSHIKKNILQKAVDQFVEKTDISISFEEQKLGKRVDRVIITVSENNKGSNDFMKSIRHFINYIREKYKPNVDKSIYPTIVVAKGGDQLKIDNNGHIYIKPKIAGIYPKKLDHKQADKIWTWLYEGVKSGELELIPPPGAKEERKAEPITVLEPQIVEKKNNEERVNKIVNNLIKRF